MLKIQVNSNATAQMQAVINKINTFPNRIASIQESALRRSSGQIQKMLEKEGRAGKYLKFEIKKHGSLGMKLSISPPSRENLNEYYAAVIFLKGRKGGKIIRAKHADVMKVREESVQKGYPKYLKMAKLGSIRGKEDIIRDKTRNIILKNLKHSIERFGFGPRGGASGLEEMPMVRSRAR